MKRQLRNNIRLSFSVLLALLLCSLSLPINAQQRGRKRPKPVPQTQSSEIERARRAKAVTLLTETAEAARALDDFLYRARLQTIAADALWSFDQQRARAVFRHAWEAATLADRAEQEAAAQGADATPETFEVITEARDEVLSKTATRDASLADVFLRELLKDKSESNPDQNETARSTTWHEPSATGARRIALGHEMLEQGEAESALKIVAPVAGEGTSPALMTFLLRLRGQNAPAGDALYRLMIAATGKDASANANTVLLLSTPIVSPELMMAIDEFGTLQFRPVARFNGQASSPPPVSPIIRKAFFNTAASVLLRPVRAGASELQDKGARYFAISRLLPFFEREVPALVPELQARATALFNDFTESRRTSLSTQLDLRAIGTPPSNDPLRSHVEELSRTKEVFERDRITIRIVLVAAQTRAWDRARRAAAELSDEGMRRAAESYIAVHQIADIGRAYADEKEDDAESIVSFLKSVDVPPLAAAWGYAQAAQVAARKKDTQRVAELLTEAEHYAGRVDAGTSGRVAAYAAVAKYAARLDRQRAWELLTQLVKAANALEDYAGDEASVAIEIDERWTLEAPAPFTLTADVFRLDSIFATMALLDFDRALTSARTLEGDVPKVFAQLAIARATLEKK